MKNKNTSFLHRLGSLWGGKKTETCHAQAAVCSDVGQYRKNNEDNFILCSRWNKKSADHEEIQDRLTLAENQWTVFGVFDGMGGGEQGEVASATAVKCVLQVSEGWNKDTKAERVCEDIRAAFLEANNQILKLRQESGIYGTTGSLMVTNGVYARIFHLGDSRIYQLRDGILKQMTKDQTLANMKIQAGFYSPNDPLAEKEKHYLTEFIGCDRTGQGLIPLQSEWFAIEDEDRYLFCSDGLYDMLGMDRIASLCDEDEKPLYIVQDLVDEANENGGLDNVTCLLLEF